MAKAKKKKHLSKKHTKKSPKVKHKKSHKTVKKSKHTIKKKKQHKTKKSIKKPKKIVIKPIKFKKSKQPTEIVMQPIVLKVVLPKEICDSYQEFVPNLSKLPPWESRQALKNFIFSKNLKFYCVSRASPDFQTVMGFFNESPYQDVSGHFVICVKSSSKIVGALDGYIVDNVLVLGNSYVKSDKRILHLLLYAAALTRRESNYVVCSTRVDKPSIDFVGMLNLLGRGFGMYAVPYLKSTFVFVRRIKKEGPVTNGQEIAHILRSLRLSGDHEIRSAVFEFNKRSLVSLIPLPMSLDRKENLYELKDSGSSLGFSTESLDRLIGLLKQSKLSYKDLTPETLF
ncbi:hypothetical protein KJ972_03650 [Candidatus Micrarchaeota archaeon]|nr:hypothetical protein [Candidatus Micrarchaeota archaeon]